mgnify:CR=1 FL=1
MPLETRGLFLSSIAVAKQIVNGTNYKFMTIAEPKEPAFYRILQL